MRFTLRPGSDEVVRADPAILAAMGLPGGGVIRLGNTHALVRPGDVRSPNDLLVGPEVTANSGLAVGASAEATRVNLPAAVRVSFGGAMPADPHHLSRALHGRPVTIGDRVAVAATETQPATTLTVAAVLPGGAALVAATTALAAEDAAGEEAIVTHHPGAIPGAGPTTATALVAGLDTEVDTLAGWIRLDGLAARTDGLSFADLAGLLREAALTALCRDPKALAVTAADLAATVTRAVR